MKFTPEQQKTLLQTVITLFLVAVLAAIVYGYIYFGMMKAKSSETLVPTETATITPVATGTDERQAIIDALQIAPASPEDNAETQEIINALSTPSTPTAEEEAARQEILEALSQE